MALATLGEMSSTCNAMLLAPPGPIHAEALRCGTPSRAFASGREFAALVRSVLARHRRVAFIATSLRQSALLLACNLVYRRDVAHVHVVHGGAEEAKSYGRKRWLNRASVAFVAVSDFVKTRLIAHGVRPALITVIENFLPTLPGAVAKRRGPFARSGIERVLVISRLDPLKRVDLLLDALDMAPDLRSLAIRILGSGWDAQRLEARAAERHPNVTFVGFTTAVEEELAVSDVLVHCCPVEPFGLAIVEAMAAGVPVVVPNSGGAASLVEDGISGFHFRADDAASLVERLRALRALPAERLNNVVAGGRKALSTRFSAHERIADYQRLIARLFSPPLEVWT
jgi:glycosyltransferase involved in cell wall biosynthesis